jgi:cell division ATPase FtsA
MQTTGRRFSALNLISQVRGTSSPKPKYFSLIDLGSDTIKVAVVEVGAGRVAVLGHSLATTQGRNVAGGRAEAAALAATVNGALKEAEDASAAIAGQKVVPDHALFILPGRTLAGKLFTVKQRRPDPAQAIGQREVEALWERATRLAQQGLPALPEVNADWIPQTISPAGLWLNNRLVNDLIGLQGQTISLAVYGVICQPAIVRGLEQLAERLELTIYRMVPACQALTAVIPAREALVFDIGWGGTDCYLIRHDALVAAGHAFMGGDFFTRALAKVFKHNVADAEALKLAYSSSGVLSDKDKALVERGLRAAYRRWAGLVIETINHFEIGDMLPGQIYFAGGSVLLPGLQIFLLERLKAAGFTFDRAPDLTNLGDSPLPGYSHAPTAFRGMLFAPVLSLAKVV